MKEQAARGGERVPFFPILLPLVLLTGTFAAVLLTGSMTYSLGTAKALAFLVTAASAACILVAARARREAVVTPGPVAATYLLFAVAALLPLAWSSTVYDVLPAAAMLAGAFVVLVCLSASRWTPALLAALPALFLALVGVLALVGILEAAGLVSPFGTNELTAHRVLATMGNPDYLGAVLVLSAPLGCGAGLAGALPRGNAARVPGLVPRLLPASAATVAAIALLVLTASRAAWAGAAVAAGLFISLAAVIDRPASPPRGDAASRRRLAVAVLVFVSLAVGAGIVLASPFLRQRVAQTVALGGLDPEKLLASRLPIWKSAVSVWLSRPPWSVLFGSGPGSFYALMFTHYPPDFGLSFDMRSARHAHSQPLELLAESGIIGLSAWLLFVGAAAAACVRVLRAPDAPRASRLVAAGITAGIAGSLVQSLASVALQTPGVVALFVFLAGLAEANAAAALPARDRRALPLGAAVALAVLGLAAAVSHAVVPFASERLLQRAMEADGRAAARALVQAAAARNPRGVSAIYEELKLVLDPDPRAAVALADRIDALIPGYRKTDRYRGIALSTLGDFPAAAVSFARYVTLDSIEPSTYVQLAGCLVMSGDAEGAAAALRGLFTAQHGKAMAERDRIMDLPPATMAVVPAGSNRGYENQDGSWVAEVSAGWLASLTQGLVAARDMGYLSVLVNLYLNVGDAFRQLRYGDLCLVYYRMAVDSGMLGQRERDDLYALTLAFADRARALRERAQSSRDPTRQYWADVWLATYLRDLTGMRPDEGREAEYRALLAEIETLRYRKR
jgi:O-antigen ligase